MNYYLLGILMDSCGNSSRFVKLYDIDNNGNYRFIRMIDVKLRKECPNCYVMFLKIENLCSIRNANQNESIRFYKCRSCGCRIKTYECQHKTMCSQDSAYSSRKMYFTDIDNEPATTENPRFQRNVKDHN